MYQGSRYFGKSLGEQPKADDSLGVMMAQLLLEAIRGLENP